MNRIGTIAVVLSIVMLSGCLGYYQVTDTVNGTDYYTKKVKNIKGGGVSFTDASNGATVTLQSNEVKKIDKDTYKANVEESCLTRFCR